jgi:membrane-bound lytic murein transglycosylase B
MTRARMQLAAWIIGAFASLALASSTAVAQSASGGGPVLPSGDLTGTIAQPAPQPRPRVAQSTFPFLPSLFSPQPQQAPSPGGEKNWSGEDGASGHPLMTAQAIREAAANFDNCVASLWPEAARRGISQESFQRFTQGLTPDLRIMDLMDSQPEFTKAVWDYLDILVSDARLQRGREVLAQYKTTFDAVEKAYGVDRHIVAAIWGIESNYSTMGGDRSVLRSTATLSCIGRRQAYFRNEFLSALEILHHGDLRPEQMVGSWAGAFGPTQFMPTAFKRYAVDFDQDGRRDVVDDVTDLIASTANNLKKDGWQAGQSWGYEVVVPPGFDYMLADRARQMPVVQWERLGLKRPNGQSFPRPADQAFLLAPAGSEGPAFLMLQNFRVILRYNPAEAYALAIGHFADRLRGGAPFVQPWPRQERVLSRAERLELQQLLVQRGFYRGQPDGQLGGETRKALRDYQASVGAPADGFATAAMLDRLRSQ